MSVVSRQTMDDLSVVASFFAIDLDSNRHIFRAAADTSNDAFATTFAALAGAVRNDQRLGINERIRRQIAAKGKK